MESKRRSKKIWLILALLLLLLILFLWGLIPRIFNTREIKAIAAEDDTPRVTLQAIKPNTQPIELILPSSAQAWHITPIWARTTGYLIQFLVDIGDVVKQGDLLAEIDTPEIDQELAQAQADLVNSISQRDIAKITADRWQTLWDKNREAVTKQDVDQYNANLKSTQALVVANEKNVSRLTFLQQFKKVYAPFDGIITQRTIDIGSLITGDINGNQQQLFQLAHPDIIRFYVDVPQNYFRNIRDGIETEVSVQEFPGKIFKGRVTRFANALDPVARTLQTEVDVENPEKILYTGLFGKVKFLLHPETINFIIPTTAIVIRAGFPHVAVVDKDNIVHMQKVSIGRDYGKKMEIVLGLQEGDRIVTIPSDKIKEGAKVKILSIKEG